MALYPGLGELLIENFVVTLDPVGVTLCPDVSTVASITLDNFGSCSELIRGWPISNLSAFVFNERYL
jgi:hypothetical protein